MNATVALVLPASEERRSSAISQAGAEHLGLGYLAAYLRQRGDRVKVLNFQVDSYLSYWEETESGHGQSAEDCARRVLAVEPDLVGMSITGVTMGESLALARALKLVRPDLHICWGGHQAYYSAEEILAREECVDTVVAGDGEITLGRLVDAVTNGGNLRSIPGLYLRANGGVLSTGLPPEPDLDALPSPSRDTIEEMIRRGARVTDARISTSRGCPFKCTFCVDPSLGYRIKWRARSADRVVDEMKDLVERYGVSFFWFSEDNFIPPTRRGRARAARIADLLIEASLDIGYRSLLRADAIHGQKELLERLVDSGLACVYIGIESGSPRRLEYFKKCETPDVYRCVVRDLREARVGLQIGFIMFDPFTSWEDLEIDGRFLHEIGEMYLYSNFCQVLDVFPGTEISQMMMERGLLDPGFSYDSPYDEYDYEVPGIGVMGRACQAGYDEEAVELDKFFQRLTVVDLPALWRLERRGRLAGVESVREVADRTRSRLNDNGLAFFLDVLQLARNGWSGQRFARRVEEFRQAARAIRAATVRELGRLPGAQRECISCLVGASDADSARRATEAI